MTIGANACTSDCCMLLSGEGRGEEERGGEGRGRGKRKDREWGTA